MPSAVPDWLLPAVGSVTGASIGTLVAARIRRSREVGAPGNDRAIRVECWVRVVAGAHPPLTHCWRVGRAVVGPGSFELRLFRWGARPWKRPPFTIHVEAIDRDGAQRSGWRQSLRFGDSHRLVAVRTGGGGELQVALRPGDVDAVLDVLQGRSRDRPQDGVRHGRSPRPGVREESRARGSGREHLLERTVRAVGWTAVNSAGEALPADDVAGQLSSCLADVQAQLAGVQTSVSDVVHVTVRTTDFPAARAHAGALGSLLRQGGAAAAIKVVGVEHLPVRGAVVELEATAVQYSWSSGRPWEEELAHAPVPEFLRAVVMAEMDALVRGERPEQRAQVDDHFTDGSALIDQPEEVWEHPWSQASRTRDGVWEVVVPLWTTSEAPSDLSASVEIDPSGKATLWGVS